MSHNAEAYDKHLILGGIAIKFKNYEFLYVAENCQKFIFSSVGKIF